MERKLRVDFLLLLVLSAAVAFEVKSSFAQAPAITPQVTVAVQPTVAAPQSSNNKRCCFCVSPDPGQKDAEVFGGICKECMKQMKDCDSSEQVTYSQFTKELLEKRMCDPQKLKVTHLQHGPNRTYASNIIAICSSLSPTCVLNLNDKSCKSYTFNSDQEERRFLESLKAKNPHATISLCGSVSTNSERLDCTSDRLTKTYNISPDGLVATDIGECPQFGSACATDDAAQGGVYSCKIKESQMLGVKRCCPAVYYLPIPRQNSPYRSRAFWSDDSGSCYPQAGTGCNPLVSCNSGPGCCESYRRCGPLGAPVQNVLEEQRCFVALKLLPGGKAEMPAPSSNVGVCVKESLDCPALGRRCGILPANDPANLWGIDASDCIPIPPKK